MKFYQICREREIETEIHKYDRNDFETSPFLSQFAFRNPRLMDL